MSEAQVSELWRSTFCRHSGAGRGGAFHFSFPVSQEVHSSGADSKTKKTRPVSRNLWGTKGCVCVCDQNEWDKQLFSRYIATRFSAVYNCYCWHKWDWKLNLYEILNSWLHSFKSWRHNRAGDLFVYSHVYALWRILSSEGFLLKLPLVVQLN